MDIKADVKSIKSLKDYFFVVPDYQREYVWKAEENVSRFLQDIYDEFNAGGSNQSDYFIGNTILVENNEQAFDVVDGQQRLTTIIITLCAIRLALGHLVLEDLDLNEQKLQLEKVVGELLYEYDFKKRKPAPRLSLQYSESKDYLENLIFNKSFSEEYTPSIIKMKEAYEKALDFLSNDLKSTDNSVLINFIQYFLHNVQMVIIRPDNLGSALKIFETINERGVGLNAMDLLKNLLFINADKNEFEEIKQIWKEMLAGIDRSGEGDKPLRFLRYFLISRYSTGKIIREDEIYKWIITEEAQKAIKYKTNPIRFAKELRSAAGKYAAFVNATKSWEADRLYPDITGIGYLTKKTSRQHLVLLMALKDNTDHAIINLLASNIESLVFYYSANRTLTKSYEEKFARWAAKLRSVATIDELRDFLLDDFKKELDEELMKFNSQFANRSQGDFNPQYRIKYIFGKIENYIRGKVNFPLANYSFYQSQQLEHILPQTGENIPKDKFPEYYDYQNAVTKFGNLTLLEAPINQSLNFSNDISSNQWFDAKKNAYLNSNILLTRTFSEIRIGEQTAFNSFTNTALKTFDEWNKDTVQERQEIFRKLILEIWQLELSINTVTVPVRVLPQEKAIENVAVGDKFKIERIGKGVNAKGYKYSEDGKFMVLAGSTIAVNAADSMPAKAAEVRKSCEDDGIIVNGVFTKDFEFNSWSLAAGVVLGCSASGPKEWRPDNN
jgi:uncharacterized protein with ParB-like and HNH nuclease domain